MAFFGKEYTLVSQENFDGFLKSVGLPDEKLKVLLAEKPSQSIVQNGDTYTLTTNGIEGKRTVTFKSGVEVEDVIGVGEKVKSTYTVNGNTVTQVVKGPKANATFKREFNGDDLVVTITTDVWDGVAKRYYKA